MDSQPLFYFIQTGRKWKGKSLIFVRIKTGWGAVLQGIWDKGG
jgi:hypothetical protein